ACVFEDLTVTSSDAGPGASYTWDFGPAANPGTAAGLGPHTVQFNQCGEQVIQLNLTLDGCRYEIRDTISINDDEAPNFPLVYGDITVSCDDIPAVPVFTVTDNCDPDPEILFNENIIPGPCANFYTIRREWTTIDTCGNANTMQQFITVEDADGPDIDGVPADTIIDCTAAVPPAPVLVAADNCDITVPIFYSETTLPGACDGSTIVRREWFAKDACGFTTYRVQNITLVDTTAPTFVYPADTIIDCDAPLPTPPAIVAIDDCDPDIEVTYTTSSCESYRPPYYETSNGVALILESEDPAVPASVVAVAGLSLTSLCTSDPSQERRWEVNNPNAFPVYVNWFVVGTPDFGGHLVPAGTSFFFSPHNTLGVHILQLSWLDETGATQTTALNAIDAQCELPVGIACDICRYRRVFTATDDCGNVATVTQNIIQKDLTAPVLVDVPGNTGIECQECISSFLNGSFENNSATQSPDSLHFATVEGWRTTASDGRIEFFRSGEDGINSAEGGWHVEVNGGALGDLNQEYCVIEESILQVSFAHHKRIQASNTTNDSMEVYIGPDLSNLTLYLTVGADDASGWMYYTIDYLVPAGQNTAVVAFRSKQGDPTDPTMGNLLDDVNSVTLFNLANQSVPSALDNCDNDVEIVLTEARVTGACPNNYRLVRTWTATDDCGNQSQATQWVTVGDLTPPEIMAPQDTVIDCTAAVPFAVPVYDDACTESFNIVTTFQQDTVFQDCNDYTIVRTWTATDECSNVSTATQLIVVQDTTAPVIGTTGYSSTSAATQIHTMANGGLLMYGTASGVTSTRVSVTFPAPFDSIPAVFADIITHDDPETVVPRITNITTTGFQIRVQEEEDRNAHLAESIAWVAMEEGSVTSGSKLEVRPIGNVTHAWSSFTHQQSYSNPITIIDMQRENGGDPCALRFRPTGNGSELEVFVEEEASADTEIGHTTEPLSYLTFEEGTIYDSLGRNIGEAGVISLQQTSRDYWQSVSLARNYTNPSVVVGPWSFNDSEPSAVRIRNLSGSSFEIQLEEWEYLDGIHNREYLHYVVIGEAASLDSNVIDPLVLTDMDVPCDAVPDPPTGVRTQDDCNSVDLVFAADTLGTGCGQQIRRTWTATDECGNASQVSQTLTLVDNVAPVFIDPPADITIRCQNPPAPPAIVQSCTSSRVNVALNKAARQSSNQNSSNNQASFAVDGDTTNYSHTQSDPEAWWEVDLEAAEIIDDIQIWNRTDCCQNRLSNFYVLVSNDPFASDDLTSTLADPAVTAHYYSGYFTESNIFPIGHQGRYVRVQLSGTNSLHMAEVAVYATKTADDAICITDNCDNIVDVTLSEVSTQTDNNSCNDINYTITRTWTATDDCGNTATHVQVITARCECCRNGIDDDGDGLVDGNDPECPCVSGSTSVACDTIFNYYVPSVWQMRRSSTNQPSNLVITTPFPSANVTVRTADGSFNNTYTVVNGTPTIIPLTIDQVQTPNINTVEGDRGFIVESDRLLQVYYRLDGFYNKLLVTIKGEQALGRAFRTGSQTKVCSGQAGGWDDEHHMISVMAVEDNTTVNFEFVTEMEGLAGLNHSVTLDAGETYLVIDTDANETISGSLVTADKPIALLSGSQHTNQCGGNGGGRDGGVDQLVPSCLMGDEYVVVKGYGGPGQNYAVVVGIENDTEVYVNGNPTKVANLFAGEWVNVDLTGAEGSSTYIRANKPIYVYHISGISTSNTEVGMALAAPAGPCRGDTYTEFPQFDGAGRHSAYVIIPDAGLPSLELNGRPYTDYTSATVTSVPGFSGYSTVYFFDADLLDYNILTSDDYYHAGLLIGNNGATGTHGYLTSFKDKIDVPDPITGLPTSTYFVDTLCENTSITHCMSASSCANLHTITGLFEGAYTGSLTMTPGENMCFDYTAGAGFSGEDQITVVIENDFGLQQAICLRFYICAGVPDIIAPDTIVSCENAIPPPDDPVATHSCDTEINFTFTELSDQTSNGSCSDYNYTITRTWTASDKCGNTSMASQNITVVDTIAPVLSPVDDAIYGGCAADAPIPTVTATDNCDPNVDIDYRETSVFNPCPNTFTLTRVWTATDQCGNTSEITQYVEVIDDSDPTLGGVPVDTVISCEALPYPVPTVTAIDNCELLIPVFNEQIIPGACPSTFDIIRTWTATDGCGNIAQQSQTINVVDTVAPVLVDIPADTFFYCVDLPVPPSGVFAYDNCTNSDVVVSLDTIAGACGGSFTIRRTWTATDICGNASIRTQLVSVSDTTAPVFNAIPPDVTVACDNLPDASTIDASDACDPGPVTITFSDDVIGGLCFGSRIINRTWTASDGCGNSASINQRITVFDNEDPTFDTVPQDTVVDCTALPFTQNITASDNCGGTVTVTFTDVTTAGSCGNESVITRTWTAEDDCGNDTQVVQVITVVDTLGPILAGVPPDTVVTCEAIPPALVVTATDACDTNPIPVLFAEVITPGGVCSNEYQIERTWTATDVCGNTTQLTQTITVVDTLGPVLSGLPLDVTVDCAAVPDTANVTATDNCDLGTIIVDVFDSVSPGSCPQDYVITRIWRASDSCGNLSEGTQVITVTDSIAPTFANVDSLPRELSCAVGLPDLSVVTVTDNCGAVTVTVDSIYTTPVIDTCTSLDPNDVDAYVILAANKVEMDLGTVRNGGVGVWNDNRRAIINSGSNIQTFVRAPRILNDGTSTIANSFVANAPDPTTEMSLKTIGVVSTVDSIVPNNAVVNIYGNDFGKVQVKKGARVVFHANSDIYIDEFIMNNADDGDSTIVMFKHKVDVVTNRVNIGRRCYVNWDSSGMPPRVIFHSSGTVSVNAHSYFHADVYAPNNTINVQDATVFTPVTMIGRFIARVVNSDNYVNWSWNTDCGGTVVITDVDPCTEPYAVRYTWTATDECGNEASHTHSVNIIPDTLAPVITVDAPDTLVTCANVPPPAVMTAVDECATNLVTNFTETAGSGCDYTILRMWTAEDECGNVDTVLQTIQVVDTLAPLLLNFPNDTTVHCTAVPDTALVTVTDDCDVNPIAVAVRDSVVSNNCVGSIFTIYRIFSAVDICGNEVENIQTITVGDDVAPDITCPADLTVECSDPSGVIASFLSSATASDNCGRVSLDNDYDPTVFTGCNGTGTQVITFTATDQCGNTATCTA
ncbi:MAG: discoidin domain-containing protein, partial [Bacteroidota bacterium]